MLTLMVKPTHFHIFLHFCPVPSARASRRCIGRRKELTEGAYCWAALDFSNLDPTEWGFQGRGQKSA